MGLIVDIDENEDRRIIRYSRYPLFRLCLFASLVTGFLATQWHAALWLLSAPLFVSALVIAVACWKYNLEVIRAMRSTSVKATGSKWSFSDPITIEISKQPLPSVNPSSENSADTVY